MSSTDRCGGRWAQKTVVASVTPKRARVAATIAVTVMNATVPRPSGPSAREMSTSARNRPAFPRICAHRRGADPPAIDSGAGSGVASGGSAATRPVDQAQEDVRRPAMDIAEAPAVGRERLTQRRIPLREREQRARQPFGVAGSTQQAASSPSP